MARLIRFGAVGATTSAAYALVVAALAPVMAEATAAALAYLALLPVNYLGHRRATFRSRAPSRPELVRYLAVHSVTMATCMAVMQGVTAGLGQSHWAGSAVIVVLAPVMNFVLLQRWVFR
jgi:putative flippase GtrA